MIPTAQLHWVVSAKPVLELSKNQVKAVTRFERAVDANDKTGIVHLGLCLLDEPGAEQNSQRAAALPRTAANMDKKDAKILLGLCFRRGEGVERDDKFAMELLHQAASR